MSHERRSSSTKIFAPAEVERRNYTDDKIGISENERVNRQHFSSRINEKTPRIVQSPMKDSDAHNGDLRSTVSVDSARGDHSRKAVKELPPSSHSSRSDREHNNKNHRQGGEASSLSLIPPLPVQEAHRIARSLITRLRLPLTLSSSLRVLSLGTIIHQHGYYTRKHIIPAGFISERLFYSISKPSRKAWYRFHVLRGGSPEARQAQQRCMAYQEYKKTKVSKEDHGGGMIDTNSSNIHENSDGVDHCRGPVFFLEEREARSFEQEKTITIPHETKIQPPLWCCAMSTSSSDIVITLRAAVKEAAASFAKEANSRVQKLEDDKKMAEKKVTREVQMKHGEKVEGEEEKRMKALKEAKELAARAESLAAQLQKVCV